MLLRSRCGENCRCEKEHNTDSLRRTKPRGSSRHLRSGGNLSVSEQSNIRETISTVHTKTNSITFSPLEFSTPIRPQGVPWVATAERTTLPSATATDLSLLSLGSSRTAKAQQQQPVGILKWTEEEGGTELQSTKQVRFGNCILQNGGTHHGTLYSDSEESVDGEERGAGNSSWQHRLQQQQQQQQGIPNGLSKGQDPAQTVTTTTTTTTETVMTDMPREEVFSDTDDEVFATEQQSRGGWGPQQRAVYLVPSDNGASPSFWGAALHRQQLRQQHQQDEREGRRQALLAAMAREADERYVAQHQRPLLIRAILGLFVGLWKLVYIATAGYIVADAWVLSRVSQQRRKRLTVALFFLIMVPLLLWLLHEEQGVANVCIQSAGSHVYEVVSEAAKSLGMATAYLSAPLSWLSWPFSGSPSTAPPPPVAPVVLQANHVTVGKQVPEPQLLSEQRLEDLVQKVLKRLSLQAPSDDRAAGKTKEDLERLRQELEAHKTTVEQLLLRVGDLKDCCRDTATLLAGLDSKIVARVLEVMNDSSSEMAPRSVLHRWLTEEMDRREAIFGASVDVRLGEHRDSVQAAVNTASQQVAQVQRVAMEAHRKAEEAIMEARRAPAVVAEMTRPDAPAMNDVTRVVKEMLAKYDADKTGLPDYALESAGGSVVNTRCTETYSNGGRRYYMFGLPIWTFTRSPRDAITPGMHPGECWAFRGSQGHLVIKLSQRIRVTAISVEHIARSLVSSGHTSSAPRDFQIWGLESETDSSGRLLGSYTYDADGDTLQYFIVQTPEPAIYDYVEMKILSNHGNLDYTCLYRLRVHGEPAS